MEPANSVDRRRRILDGELASRGNGRAYLTFGAVRLRLDGLAQADLAELRDRWGEFLTPRPSEIDPDPIVARRSIRFCDSGTEGWLPPARPGDVYRVESVDDPAGRWALSYNFAVHRLQAGGWVVAVRETEQEPFGRVLDNAVRFVVAQLTADLGGLALHAAAALRGGRAYVLAGPSNAGKTTAVSMLTDGRSLGDDMTLVLRAPDGKGWVVPAVPFDNTEAVAQMPPVGPHALAGIWKLHQASEHRIERPPAILATASLISCASFSWAMPELADRIAQTAGELQACGLFAHLHFAKDPGFGPLLG